MVEETQYKIVSVNEEIRLNGSESEDEEENLLLSKLGQKEEEKKEELPAFVQRLKAYPSVAYWLIFMSSVFNTVVGVLIKQVSEVDPLMLLALRGVFLSCVALSSLAYLRQTPFPRDCMKRLVIRACAVAFFMISLYYGFRYLPLGDCRTIAATQVIWVAIFGHVFLGEKCGLAEMQTVVTVLIGKKNHKLKCFQSKKYRL